MKSSHDAKLQSLCRDYLSKIRPIARSHGLETIVDCLLEANASKQCSATEAEVLLLSRVVDDERISRTDVPKILGKSYRKCVEEGDFEKVKTLRHVGIYSKVSALLLKRREE